MLFNQISRAAYTLRGKPTPQEQAERASGIAERVTKGEQRAEDHARRLDFCERGLRETRELITSENGKLYERVKEVAEDTNIMRGELKGIKDNTALLLQRVIRR
jgi:hypothetical protein